jgi:hypothetical protein
MNLFELARMNYMAYAIGEPKSIPQLDIDEYARRNISEKPERTARTRADSSTWHYYKQQLGEA